MTAKARKTKSTKKLKRSSTVVGGDLLERGRKYLNEGEYKSAKAVFENIKEKYPGEKDLLVKVKSYLRICDNMLARRFSPSSVEDYYNLGIFKHNEGQYDEAIKHLNEALKLEPKADHVHYALAAAYAMKRDHAQALKCLERAVKLNPDNAVFARNDEDLAALREEKAFKSLVGSS